MARINRSGLVVVLTGLIVAAIGLVVLRRHRAQANTPEAILARADALSWNNNWLEAAPLYARAERLFREEGKQSEALYAHVSQFIPRAEAEPLPGLLFELRQDQQLQTAQDANTKLRLLVIRGMIETNYDAGMASQTWAQVETLAERRGEIRLMFRAMGEQGVADFLRGDFSSARKRVTRAWLAAKALSDGAAHVRYASLYGTGLVELQKYSEGIHALDEAINTATKDRRIAYPSIALNAKINALRGLHQYKAALDLSDEIVKRLPANHLDAHLFDILTSKGTIHGDMGNWSEAIAQYEHALQYGRHLQHWRGISQTGGLLAVAYEHQDNLPAALASVNEAIDDNTKLPDELYFSPRNLAIKAEILARMGRTKESHALYEKSMMLIDSLLATVPTPNVERQLVGELEKVYSSYYNILCSEGNLNSGFRTIEKARGLVEVQALEHHTAVQPHAPTPQERRISELNLELIRTDNPAARQQLAQSLYQAELQLDDSSLAASTVRRPMDIRDVQQRLRPDELLLEYVLDDTHSSVLAITSHSAKRHLLPPRDALLPLISQYRKAIHGRKKDDTVAQTLLTSLLGPIEEYRTHPSVIVVPDGEINLVPFPALADQGAYVVATHTFSSSPSATVLCLLRERESSAIADRYQYVGVAAWTSGEKPKSPFGGIFRSISMPKMDQLQTLPSSKKEVETIALNFGAPSTLLLGPAATETSFKSLPLDQYRVLHLALHGYADVEYPDRSALVFAPQGPGADDGLLEVREVRMLRLQARLVTLSACNTGVGPVGAVDVADLGHAFIEAGAETVVSALWELNDQTTMELMTSFYKNLATHQSKAQALQQAQLTMMRTGISPYYWASFEVIGDPAGVLE